jgi:plasmid stability protein
MRTTVDVPDALMRAAKARAAEHGESLKDLVNRALTHELGLPSGPQRKAGRVTLPLIARDASPAVLVTNDDIAAAFEAEDVERYSPS